MKEITDEMLRYIAIKYRTELFADIEKNLCLDHFNKVFELDLCENDVELEMNFCHQCKEEKPCVQSWDKSKYKPNY